MVKGVGQRDVGYWLVYCENYVVQISLLWCVCVCILWKCIFKRERMHSSLVCCLVLDFGYLYMRVAGALQYQWFLGTSI